MAVRSVIITWRGVTQRSETQRNLIVHPAKVLARGGGSATRDKIRAVWQMSNINHGEDLPIYMNFHISYKVGCERKVCQTRDEDAQSGTWA